MERSPTYCALPFRHAAILSDGSVRPCCRYESSDLNAKGRSASEQFWGEEFTSIRDSMKQGAPLPGCKACFSEERQGLQSLRQKSNRLHPEVSGQLESLELFVGRSCNMKCRMCSTWNSTFWDEDASALGEPVARSTGGAALDGIEVSLLKELKLVGGEPFLAPNFRRILELAGKRCVPMERLTFSTNGSYGPTDHWLRLFRAFGKVEISFSVDGVGHRAEYIRHGVSWEQVKTNLTAWSEAARRESRFDLNAHLTLQAYNGLGLAPVLHFLAELKNVSLVVRKLEQPEALQLRNLPLELRIHAADELRAEFAGGNLDKLFKQSRPGLKEFLLDALETDEIGDFPAFLAYTKRLDRLRGENIFDVDPALQTHASKFGDCFSGVHAPLAGAVRELKGSQGSFSGF